MTGAFWRSIGAPVGAEYHANASRTRRRQILKRRGTPVSAPLPAAGMRVATVAPGGGLFCSSVKFCLDLDQALAAFSPVSSSAAGRRALTKARASNFSAFRRTEATRQARAAVGLFDHPANDVAAFRPAGGGGAYHGALAFIAEMQKRQEHERQRRDGGGDQDKRGERVMKQMLEQE